MSYPRLSERAAKWGSPAPHTAPISGFSASTSAALGHYPAPGPPAPSREPCPVQRPVHRVTPPDRHVASSAQQTAAADAPLADRWVGLWKAKDEARAAAGRAPGNPHTALTAPPPALAEPSGAPAAAATAAPDAPASSASAPPAAPSAPAPAAPDAPASSAAAPPAPAAPSAPAAAQPHVPTAPRRRRRPRRRPTFAPAAAPSAELLVLPNGTIIPCFPRLYLDTRFSPALLTAASPAAPSAPSAPFEPSAPSAAASKEVFPAAAEPRAPPEAPASPPSMALFTHVAWLGQRLQEELEQLTLEEALELFC
jgi:hypothetical protein